MSTMSRAARRVAHAHVPRRDHAEPVLLGVAYGLSAVLFHSLIGTLVVSVAYTSVAALAYVDVRRERHVSTVEPDEPCYGAHAVCRFEPAD